MTFIVVSFLVVLAFAAGAYLTKAVIDYRRSTGLYDVGRSWRR